MASLDALLALLAPADAAAFESKAARAVLGAVLEKHGGDAAAAAAAVTAVLDADREEAAGEDLEKDLVQIEHRSVKYGTGTDDHCQHRQR